MRLQIIPDDVVIAPGSSLQATVRTYCLQSRNRSLGERSVTWSSSAASIASVSSRGTITGLALGTTNVNASSGPAHGMARITVSTATPVSLILSPFNPYVASSTQFLFTVLGHYSDGSTHNMSAQVTWAVSDSSKATIDNYGLLTPVTPGNVTISATFPKIGTVSELATIGPSAGPSPLSNASQPLVTPTYDGSGQAVEPSIRYFPNAWHGYNYWIVISPYPDSNPSKENPSILVSDDGVIWTVPPGLANPIAAPTSGHLADASLFYDQVSDQLWVYYFAEEADGDHLLRIASSDGVHWGAPADLLTFVHLALVSPSVEKFNGTYYLWSVNAASGGCSTATSTIEYRTSPNGLTWSKPSTANIIQPGQIHWHLNVIYVPSKNEFWMVDTTFPQGGTCGNTRLFFARSRDGVNWTTYPHPALVPSSGWDRYSIYRASPIYDSSTNLLKVWYSSQGPEGWHIGFSAVDFTQFMYFLEQ